MVAVCRKKQRSRPDNFWGSRVSALDRAVTKYSYLKKLPRPDLLDPQPPDLTPLGPKPNRITDNRRNHTLISLALDAGAIDRPA